MFRKAKTKQGGCGALSDYGIQCPHKILILKTAFLSTWKNGSSQRSKGQTFLFYREFINSSVYLYWFRTELLDRKLSSLEERWQVVVVILRRPSWHWGPQLFDLNVPLWPADINIKTSHYTNIGSLSCTDAWPLIQSLWACRLFPLCAFHGNTISVRVWE